MNTILRNTTIPQRLTFTFVMIALLFGAATIYSLTNFKSALLTAKQNEIQNLVDGGYSNAMYYAKLAQTGEMSHAAAKEAAANSLRTIRYGGGGYLWVNDMNSTMVMHPIKPALEGKTFPSSKMPTENSFSER